MGTRRAVLGLAFGAAGAAAWRIGLAEPAGGQQQGQAGEGGLRDRGAPVGRTGAATRGADGEATLDLVAPLRGVGLCSTDQPELCYLLSGRATQPARLAISMSGQARPLASFELPRGHPSGLGVVRLREHRVRLAPNLLCIWSVTVAVNPRAPSQDLVGTALIQYRPDGLALQAAREVSLNGQIDALVRAGYWYDAVALAERNQGSDRGAALTQLFQQAELRVPADAGMGSVP